MSNRLIHSTSPYLRQHADNPVDWYEWSDEAFAEAARRDVPVILSVGYATCHWCHVMAHESFEDQATAASMNENFVSIKVDREERPDIDRIYMDAVTAMTGRGGWPMTVFLTPDAKPIFAGTYFPKVAMGNHPTFGDVMTAVLDAWRTNRGGVENQAQSITDAIEETTAVASETPTARDIDNAVLRLSEVFDTRNGGFGGAPKFPQAPTLELLLRSVALRPGTEAAIESREMLDTMLASMAKGGIYDHLLGGFARYSVDAEWLIPHFEKMLYDNALLARVYLRAWQLTGEPLYKNVATDVLDYLDSTMADPTGAIHSAEDADSDGEEGKFAVWSWTELSELLGGDLDIAAGIYGFSQAGNFEGNNNPHRFNDLETVAAANGVDIDALLVRKRSIDTTLVAARLQRTDPARDDKIVAAWNGLAMRAFAEAGAVLSDERYTRRAEAIARFLLGDGSLDGSLARSWRDAAGHRAFADDLAAVALGLYALYQTTGDETWFREAEGLVDTLRLDFGASTGGFYATRADSTLISRPFNMQDSPTPSDNSLALEALLTHAAYTGDASATSEAEATMRALSDTALRYPSFGGYALAVWMTFLSGIDEVALVGSDTAELEAMIWSEFRPQVVLAIGDGSPSSVPLLHDRPSTSKPLAYVCHDHVCDLPVDSASGLAEALETVQP